MTNIDKLLEVMKKLRDPNGGCAWDLEQDFKSIAPYTIEEAYEVADAIERGDMKDLREELGDLLLQVVFHSQMANEAGHFDFESVAAAISEKLIKRHPHVFGGENKRDAEEQLKEWEKQKADERQAEARASGREASILDDVAKALPATARAFKLQKRASTVGFDWQDPYQPLDKLDEEIEELEEAMEENDSTKVLEEIGDIMFATINIARHLGVDPEEALKNCNAKFEKRFGYIEKQIKSQGKTMEQATLEEMDKLWDEAKVQLS